MSEDDAFGSAPRRLRLMFVSNLPTPYQVDFLEELARVCDVNAVFLWTREANRDWALGERPWLKVLGEVGTKPDWRRLAAEVANFEPDAIVVGGYRLPLAVRLRCLCAARGIRHFYWLEKPLPSTPLRALVRSLMWCATLGISNGLLCVGSDAVVAYRRFSASVTDLPYSINVDRYPVRARAKPGQPLRAVFVGQYIERKGVRELLEAFASLPPGTASLSMVGSGQMLPIVEDYARRNANIRNLGFLDPGALPECLARHDLLVLPSRHDGWAVVVAEAMAAGLPVVGTLATTAFKDLVVPNQCGLPCDVNADAIRRAVMYYVAHPEAIEEEGARGRKGVCVSLANAVNAAARLVDVIRDSKVRPPHLPRG